jgi:hypothetical protein
MATYNTGSVQRHIATYFSASSTSTTLFQAPAAPTLCFISGMVRVNGLFGANSSALFYITPTQNNSAAGGYSWRQFFTAGNVAQGNVAQGGNGLVFFSGTTQGTFQAPNFVYLYDGTGASIMFDNFLVPPSHFVQLATAVNGSGSWTLSRYEISLT